MMQRINIIGKAFIRLMSKIEKKIIQTNLQIRKKRNYIVATSLKKVVN